MLFKTSHFKSMKREFNNFCLYSFLQRENTFFCILAPSRGVETLAWVILSRLLKKKKKKWNIYFTSELFHANNNLTSFMISALLLPLIGAFITYLYTKLILSAIEKCINNTWCSETHSWLTTTITTLHWYVGMRTQKPLPGNYD